VLHQCYCDKILCRRQQYIGKAKLIDYMTAGHSTARIVVGTEQNVIAAINAHNGHIGENAFLSLNCDMIVHGCLDTVIELLLFFVCVLLFLPN